jgi:hypothetical protein
LLPTHTPGRSSDSFLVLYGEVAFLPTTEQSSGW